MRKFIVAVVVILSLPLFVILMVLTSSGSKEMKELKLAEANNVPLNIVREVKTIYGDDYVDRLVQLGDRIGFRWQYVNQSMIFELGNTDIKRISNQIQSRRNLKEFKAVLSQMYGSLEYFPVPEEVWIVKKYYDGELVSEEETERKHYNYALYNDFGEERNYKVKRPHYGNDLVADQGVPLVSMTAGTITQYGWNEHGGMACRCNHKRRSVFLLCSYGQIC